MATARRGGLDLLHEGDDGRVGQRGSDSDGDGDGEAAVAADGRATAAGGLQLPKLSSEIHKQAQHHICLENPLL
jgi:hypothetical protein